MRPGEVFALRWENILLTRGKALLQIVQGKTNAARRMLSMLPFARVVLKSRFLEQGKPREGWVFPSGSASGHLERDTAKNAHQRALAAIKESGHALKPFPPYVLRHTALTRLGENGCDIFTLKSIAGHTNITMTQRYVHPQAEAIERAFNNLAKSGRHKIGHSGKKPAPKLSRKTPISAVTTEG